MSKVKKLLATLIIMAIISSNFSLAAFAATSENQTQSAAQNSETDAAAVTPVPTVTNEADTTLNEIPADTANVSTDSNTNNENTITANDTNTKSDTKQSSTKKTTSTSKKKASYKSSDLRLLSCLIYSEAGGQSYTTMLGVANVVLNRVGSKAYWHIDNIKEAIYDRKWSVQFAVTIKNKKTGVSAYDKALKKFDSGRYNASMKKAVKAAKAALTGDNNIGSYLCFSNKNYKSYVKKHYSKYRIIDDMIFYRNK